MSKQIRKFDAVVLGSGQGGNPLARKLADIGEHVAMIESDHLGGTCINTGCTPTKTMVASAQVAHYARNATRWGVRANDVGIDLPSIVRRKSEVVMRFRTGWEKSFDSNDQVTLYRKRGRFVGPKQIQVGDEVIEGHRIFIDTGSKPTIPAIEGLSSVPYLTNVSLLELEDLPAHL